MTTTPDPDTAVLVSYAAAETVHDLVKCGVIGGAGNTRRSLTRNLEPSKGGAGDERYAQLLGTIM